MIPVRATGKVVKDILANLFGSWVTQFWSKALIWTENNQHGGYKTLS